MSSFPWLTVIGAIPLVGALIIALIPGAADPNDTATQAARDLLVERVALLVSLITLGFTVAMAVKFSPGGPTFCTSPVTRLNTNNRPILVISATAGIVRPPREISKSAGGAARS